MALFVVSLRPAQSTLVLVSLASDGPDVKHQLPVEQRSAQWG